MPRRRRSVRFQKLLAAFDGADRITVVTHDNPDPDGIAAGWGMKRLLEQSLAARVEFVAGGVITRAENRLLVDLLQPPLRLLEPGASLEDAPIVLVDTLLPASFRDDPDTRPLAAVIDHHAVGSHRKRKPRFRFRDVRPRVVSSSSMVAGYLREANIEPCSKLATAMLYGIYTDAKGQETRFSRTDRSALAWLTPFSDPDIYARIEHAPVKREYFEDLLQALASCFLYDDVGLCLLSCAAGVEIVGEVADLLIRCDGIDRLLCGVRVGDQVAFSARSTAAGGDVAVQMAKFAASLGGVGGGHCHRAGGTIPLSAFPSQAGDEVEARIRTAWLETCGVEKSRGQRLVPKREILKTVN